MDKPSGTLSAAGCMALSGCCFNFPGWINHPELSLKAEQKSIDGFQLPRMDKPSGTRMAVTTMGIDGLFQLPRMDKPSGTGDLGKSVVGPLVFQLPRMDKPSGTPPAVLLLRDRRLVSTSPDG